MDVDEDDDDDNEDDDDDDDADTAMTMMMMKIKMFHWKALMFFFSADGNFEVTLATKATLFHNGLVEVGDATNTKSNIIKLLIKVLLLMIFHNGLV